MTVDEVLAELKSLSDPNTKKTMMKHGVQEPLYGVKIGEMKKILKKTKKNHELSLGLYRTGNADAMYLAGLMADEKKINKQDLDEWVLTANSSYIRDYAVPWVASETPFGFELGLEWIDSASENIATAGWATLSSIASITPDDQLDIPKYELLLQRISKEIHSERNCVRKAMNAFIISVGCYITELTDSAKKVANQIGEVEVDEDGTKCKVPSANAYIDKVIAKGYLGKKRKEARC